MDAKYAKANIPAEIEKNCTHLNNVNQEKLLELLLEFEELLDGTLGEWKTTPAKLELKPDATQVHGAFYPASMVHKDVCKKEVKRLVELGVLKRETDSEWASSSFIIAKKSETVRFLTDFRKVNKMLV